LTRYLARKAALLLPTLVGISLFTFVLLRLIPGDPAQIMLGERATAQQVAAARAARGLDQPILLQYLHYLADLARGDWGRSIVSNLPVTAELAQRLPATVELAFAALLIACAAGIPIGVVAAHRRNSRLDWLASSGTLVGVSVPLFWLGLLLIYLFAYRLGWLPPSGRLSVGMPMFTLQEAHGGGTTSLASFGAWLAPASDLIANFYVLNSLLTANARGLADTLRHLVLPAVTLSVVPLAIIVRMTRSSVLEVLSQDHVRTARAKGLRERTVLWTHALRNAWPAVLTVIAWQLGALLSGAILVETIFSWPGVGQLVVDRVLARDYPVVQGIVLVSALLMVLVNLLADIGYKLLDPRIRYD
jgi:peptide/nickel transport system permease protein